MSASAALPAPAAGKATANDRDRNRAAADGTLRVAVFGNPNTGKSTLFNALTGMRQRVGNFPGVTVERVEGSYRRPEGRGRATVLDLPGSYSIAATTPDETIALDVLLGRAPGIAVPDVLVIVADAQNLERNLYLTSQLIELGLPTVVALNQMDAAAADGISIDVPELIDALGVTVIPTVATRGEGIEHLRHAIEAAPSLPKPARRFTLPAAASEALVPVEQRLAGSGLPIPVASLEALRLVGEGDQRDNGASRHNGSRAGDPELAVSIAQARDILRARGVNPDSLEAGIRYAWIADVAQRCISHNGAHSRTRNDRVDRVLLHKAWGPVVFIALMAVVFQAVFAWARPLMEGIEGALGALGESVSGAMPPGDFSSLIVDGVIGGVGSVLVFVPQIAILFLFIGILEDTGYMARAAFVMDRYMRMVGLHGKSFIPLLSGYACAVPAIMSARTIDHPRDRLATIMVVPLMSCSARLPVYTLLIAAFIPPFAVAGIFSLQGVTLLVMYLLGTVAAFGVAAVFRRTLLRGPVRPMLMELPPYRIPSPRVLFATVWQRVMVFLRRAGTIILALSIVLWALATYPRTEIAGDVTPETAQEMQLANSTLGKVGHAIEPAVAPLGYDWKIAVSIAASFAAREVFVATMGTIYGVGSHQGEDSPTLRERLRAERNAVTGAPVYTPLVAVGLMVFYVFALMCMSTVAITVREAGGGRIGWGWAAVQFGYMLVLAYVAALIVYQGGRMLGFGG